MTCVNCGNQIGQQFVFQGVIVCGDCYKIATHYLQRTQTELQMLVTTYIEMLRVALIKGQLRPPKLPPGECPRRQLTKAFQQLAEEINANAAAEASPSDGTVQGVRSEAEDTRRELRVGPGAEALRGRGQLRPLPQVQADRHPDGGGAAPGATPDPADGLDQTPRR